MADPLSIATSIIAVLQVAGTVVTYLNDARNASSDRNKLLLEVSASRGLLYSLKDLVERSPGDYTRDAALNKLSGPNGPLDQFRSALEGLATKLAPRRKGHVGQALSWPFVKKDIEEALKTIERLKTLTTLALQQDFILLSECIQDQVHDISRGVKDLQLRADNRERRELIAWISPLNFWPKQTDVFSGRLERTGEWFLESKPFQNWLNGTNQSLWCRGIRKSPLLGFIRAGAGKTVLASVVVDLLNRTYGPEDAGIAFLYCDYKERTQHTAINLMSSIVQQLVQRRPQISDSVNSFHQRVLSKHTRPKLDDYFDLVASELNQFPRTFIVVDALDEYIENDGTRNVFLGQLRRLQPKVSLLVTSRHLLALDTELHVDVTTEIRADNEDIERYLEFQLHHDRSLATFLVKYPELEEKIVSRVCTSAQGMFLMARLHIETLKKKHTRRDLVEALEHLPTDIYNIYDDAMQRIRGQDEDDYRLAMRVLAWISHAITPLTVQELQHALVVRPGDFDLEEDDVMGEDTFVGVCAGLVTVDQQSSIIRLVHYTTEQYFAPKRSALFPDFHSKVSVACITYLSFDAFSRENFSSTKEVEDTLSRYPFLSYASQNWPEHSMRERGQEVNDNILQLLKHSTRISNSFRVMRFVVNRHSPEIQTFSKDLTALHFATYFKLKSAVKALLDARDDSKWDGGSGWTPLHTSATLGDFLSAQLLIEHGFSASSATQHGWTVLHAAMGSGEESIVALLLHAGADVNARDAIGWAPIHLAGFHGHEHTIERVLERGAKANAQDADGITALHLAAVSNQPKSLKVLLKGGADIGMQTNKGWTALHWAAWLGKESAAEFLIENGAGLEVQAYDGATPLHLAALDGNAGLVRILLDKGANAAAQDRTGWTPLHWASFLAKDEVVAILMKLPSLATAEDKKGLTALHWAAFENKSTTMELLLQIGGQVDLKGFSGMSPLYLGAVEGHAAVVTAMLANGFDINDRDDRGWTPLHWAVFTQQEEMVQLLIDNGAEPEATDNSGLTALHVGTMASIKAFLGCAAIMALLHDSAADKLRAIAGMHRLIAGKHQAASERTDVMTNFRLQGGEDYSDAEGTTGDPTSSRDEKDSSKPTMAPENAIRQKKHDGVVERLLAGGAKIDSTFWDGRTVLHNAAERGAKVLVRLILQRGADVNAKDDGGRTPLLEAVKSGNLEVVKQLLAAGADVSARDNLGAVPVDIADRNGFLDIADALRLKMDAGN